MTLPPGAILLLDESATPERAADSMKAWAWESHPHAELDAEEALGMWEQALSSAAIRAMEARIAFLAAGPLDPASATKWQALRESDAEYHALRDWKKRQQELRAAALLSGEDDDDAVHGG